MNTLYLFIRIDEHERGQNEISIAGWLTNLSGLETYIFLWELPPVEGISYCITRNFLKYLLLELEFPSAI